MSLSLAWTAMLIAILLLMLASFYAGYCVGREYGTEEPQHPDSLPDVKPRPIRYQGREGA